MSVKYTALILLSISTDGSELEDRVLIHFLFSLPF